MSIANQLNLSSLSDRKRKTNLEFINGLLFNTIDSATRLSLINFKVPPSLIRSVLNSHVLLIIYLMNQFECC